jgi:hypothetical protein
MKGGRGRGMEEGRKKLGRRKEGRREVREEGRKIGRTEADRRGGREEKERRKREVRMGGRKGRKEGEKGGRKGEREKGKRKGRKEREKVRREGRKGGRKGGRSRCARCIGSILPMHGVTFVSMQLSACFFSSHSLWMHFEQPWYCICVCHGPGATYPRHISPRSLFSGLLHDNFLVKFSLNSLSGHILRGKRTSKCKL